MKYLCALSLPFLLLSFAAADVLLEFKVETKQEKLDLAQAAQVVKGETPPAKSPTIKTLKVYLGDRCIRVDEANEVTLYDFKNRRILCYDLVKRQVENVSLYTVLGFRQAEFKNRTVMANILSSAGVETAGFGDTQLVEHLLSFPGETQRVFQPEKQGNRTVYLSGDAEIFSHANTFEPLDPAGVKNFVQYLRYANGGHPDLLRILAGLEGIPRSFRLTFREFKTITWEYELVGTDHQADIPSLPSGFEPRAPMEENHPLHGVASATMGAQIQDFEARLKNVQEAVTTLFAAGKPLEGLLAIFEVTLMTGDENQALFLANKEHIVTSEEVRRFISVLQPGSKQEAESAAAYLKQVHATVASRSYVVAIFLANVTAALGETAEAKTLFLQALTANPLIMGVYKDLGDIYYGEYEMALAWVCWDTGRQLVPDHAILKAVNDFEGALVKGYPYYFE